MAVYLTKKKELYGSSKIKSELSNNLFSKKDWSSIRLQRGKIIIRRVTNKNHSQSFVILYYLIISVDSASFEVVNKL